MSHPTTLITGANRGIGRALAAQLGDRGHTVVLCARDLDAARTAAEELHAEAPARNVVPLRLDVTDPVGIERAVEVVGESFGRLDKLVNNAGGHFDSWQDATSADPATAAEAFDGNVLGTWRVIQAMLPLLKKSPSPTIVNVSSEKACFATMDGSTPAYRLSKVALNALTVMLANELAQVGISVYGASPGWTATELGGPAGRPVADGAASIRWVLEQQADQLHPGHVYQDGRELPR